LLKESHLFEPFCLVLLNFYTLYLELFFPTDTPSEKGPRKKSRKALKKIDLKKNKIFSCAELQFYSSKLYKNWGEHVFAKLITFDQFTK
jgi:hypothetical protein